MLHALTAQVVFSGLIAFVPVSGDTHRYKILMPEASGDQYAADGCPLPKHFPLLVVGAASCKEGTENCPGQDELLRGFGNRAYESLPLFVYPLEGKDVKILFTKAPLPPARMAERTGSGTVPRDRQDAGSSYWIPTMPRLEKVDPACLDPDDIGQCPLAARAEIKGAPLETCHLVELSTNDQDQLCASRFKTARWSWLPWGRLARAVADSTVMNFNLEEGTQATIEIKDLKQKWSKDLSWVVTPRSASPNLVIWILDEPLPMVEMEGVRKKGKPDDPCIKPAVGTHYQLFYNLAARDSKGMPVSPRDRPYPVEFIDCVRDAPILHQPEHLCPSFTDDKQAPGGKFPFYRGNITHCGLLAFSQ
jgi:hypothetical protein